MQCICFATLKNPFPNFIKNKNKNFPNIYIYSTNCKRMKISLKLIKKYRSLLMLIVLIVVLAGHCTIKVDQKESYD